MKKRHQSAISRCVETALSLPSGMLGGCTKMEWTDNRQVQIDGCCAVLEYDENRIEIAAADGTIRFWGEQLQLDFLAVDCIRIRGRIQSAEFLYK